MYHLGRSFESDNWLRSIRRRSRDSLGLGLKLAQNEGPGPYLANAWELSETDPENGLSSPQNPHFQGKFTPGTHILPTWVRKKFENGEISRFSGDFENLTDKIWVFWAGSLSLRDQFGEI